MSSLDRFLYYLDFLASFVLTRFPYFCILPLLLGAAETNTSHPNTWLGMLSEPTYVHAIIYFLCGAGMTVDFTRRPAGFVAALHSGYFAVITLLRPSISEWLMLKIFARNVAVLGGYLLVAGGLVDSRQSTSLKVNLLQLGRQIQAAYPIFNAYLLWVSKPDRAVHVSHLPLGSVLVNVLIVLFVVCGVMLYSGFQSGYFARLVAWLLLIVTVFVEFDLVYWRIRGLGFWQQIHIGSQNFHAIGSLIIIGRVRNW